MSPKMCVCICTVYTRTERFANLCDPIMEIPLPWSAEGQPCLMVLFLRLKHYQKAQVDRFKLFQNDEQLAWTGRETQIPSLLCQVSAMTSLIQDGAGHLERQATSFILDFI
ncbi:hypothetical protein FKM82_005539 [Ascaphus truei]